MVEKRTVDYLPWKAKSKIVVTTGVSASQQLIHLVLQALRYSCRKRVPVEARWFFTEIAQRGFLEIGNLYEAEERRLVFPVNDTVFG
jgi:hypothetical protein